jgi:hypothetical protein
MPEGSDLERFGFGLGVVIGCRSLGSSLQAYRSYGRARSGIGFVPLSRLSTAPDSARPVIRWWHGNSRRTAAHL